MGFETIGVSESFIGRSLQPSPYRSVVKHTGYFNDLSLTDTSFQRLMIQSSVVFPLHRLECPLFECIYLFVKFSLRIYEEAYWSETRQDVKLFLTIGIIK